MPKHNLYITQTRAPKHQICDCDCDCDCVTAIVIVTVTVVVTDCDHSLDHKQIDNDNSNNANKIGGPRPRTMLARPSNPRTWLLLLNEYV